jgi:hypothetical protein
MGINKLGVTWDGTSNAETHPIDTAKEEVTTVTMMMMVATKPTTGANVT